MNKVDYIGEYKIALQKNIEEVRKDVLSNKSDMEYKISSYCSKYNLPERYVKHKILSDNVFALNFAKDPAKQTFHQSLAAKYISSIPGVEDFHELPAGGKNALYIIDGVLGTCDEVDKGNSKSIDFSWKYKGLQFYAAHKYTADEGGSQDNQYSDLKLFLMNANKSTDKTKRYLAIGDGPYYQRKKEENGQMSRIDYMNSQFETEYAKAITVEFLEQFLESIAKQ